MGLTLSTNISSAPLSAMLAVAPWLSESTIEHCTAGHTVTCTTLKSYGQNEHVFIEGDSQSYIYLVVDGVIALYNAMSDGRRQVCAFAYPGDILGLDSIGAHVNSAESLCDSTLRCIPVNAIEKLMRSEPGFGQALLAATATELADTRELMLSLGRKSAAEKMATFLLRIARRNNAIDDAVQTVSIPMKRCEIADFLGLTTETISRTLSKFKAMNIIRLESTSRVRILDMEKLQAVAEGTAAGYVH